MHNPSWYCHTGQLARQEDHATSCSVREFVWQHQKLERGDILTQNSGLCTVAETKSLFSFRQMLFYPA